MVRSQDGSREWGGGDVGGIDNDTEDGGRLQAEGL